MMASQASGLPRKCDHASAQACAATRLCGANKLGENSVFRECRDSEFDEQGADMYAVIKTGGKQYKVVSGEKIKVELLAAEVGQEIVLDQVLAVGSGADLKVGNPLVAGASVTATVVSQGRHDKVRIFKMRRRKHYQKRQGHRQGFTELQIGTVQV
jgi:large subunit ribosomal protein L21